MNQSKTKIIFATHNHHKFGEVREILRDLPIELISLDQHPDIPPLKETGKTFVENALLKAKTVYQHTQIWSVADDSGLEVDALNGAPGVYSARFSGNHHDYAENNKKLLQLLKNIPDQQRGAQFRCIVAIIGPDFKEIMEGIVRGRIITELRGNKGFGYDPLFIPEGLDKTFAELGEEMKNKISHRALAFEKLKEVLKKIIYIRSS